MAAKGKAHTDQKIFTMWGSRSLVESLDERGAVGICGGRDSGPEALELAKQIGKEIAAMGLILVSGNARGVDDAAQFGALNEGGRAISVLAEGLAGWKPRKHYRPLIDDSNYAAVSEFASEESWAVGRAMQRNGTIVEMAMTMVLVNAGTKGGTWEAGRMCLRRKKPLFVAYGDEVKSEGSAQLIKENGIPFRTTEELRALIEQVQTGELAVAESAEQGVLFSIP